MRSGCKETLISLPELPPAVTKHIRNISSAWVGEYRWHRLRSITFDTNPSIWHSALAKRVYKGNKAGEEAEVRAHQHHLYCQSTGQPLPWEAETPAALLNPIDNPWVGLSHNAHVLTAVREVIESAEWQIWSLMTSTVFAILFSQILLFTGLLMLQEFLKQKGLYHLSHSSTKKQRISRNAWKNCSVGQAT